MNSEAVLGLANYEIAGTAIVAVAWREPTSKGAKKRTEVDEINLDDKLAQNTVNRMPGNFIITMLPGGRRH